MNLLRAGGSGSGDGACRIPRPVTLPRADNGSGVVRPAQAAVVAAEGAEQTLEAVARLAKIKEQLGIGAAAPAAEGEAAESEG